MSRPGVESFDVRLVGLCKLIGEEGTALMAIAKATGAKMRKEPNT